MGKKKHDKGGGADKGGKGGKKKNAKGAKSPLAEAQNLQKKAEKQGARGNFNPQALQAYHTAIEAYLAVYRETNATDALVGLAECYFYSAELKFASTAVLDHISKEKEAEEQTVFLCKQSCDCYGKILEQSDVEHREEVLVNLGSSLSVWAEASAYPDSLGIFDQALRQYDSSLAIRPDSDTLLNKGDLLKRMAEEVLDATPPDVGRARVLLDLADKAYRACLAESDSSRGDDLTGLTESWGSLYMVWSQALKGSPQDQDVALQRALAQFNGATELDVTSTKGMNGVGDVFMQRAELSSLFTPQQRYQFCESALTKGYNRALSVNRNEVDAAVGVGEAHFQMGKILREIGDAPNACANFLASAQRYSSVRSNEMLWKEFGSVQERSDFLYNAACALAACAQTSQNQEREGFLREAIQVLEQCMAFGAVTAADVQSDEELLLVAQTIYGGRQ